MRELISVVLMASTGLLLANMPAAACFSCPQEKEVKAEKSCPEHMAGVDTKKSKLQDGLEITMTAGDKETAASVQAAVAEHYAEGGKTCKCVPKGAQVRLENLENGVRVFITGKTRGLVKKIQARADKAHDCAVHEKVVAETGGTKAAAKESANYVCPMGCALTDKPGKCPKCGMDMVEKK